MTYRAGLALFSRVPYGNRAASIAALARQFSASLADDKGFEALYDRNPTRLNSPAVLLARPARMEYV